MTKCDSDILNSKFDSLSIRLLNKVTIVVWLSVWQGFYHTPSRLSAIRKNQFYLIDNHAVPPGNEHTVNSLWPGDNIWQHRYGPESAQ